MDNQDRIKREREWAHKAVEAVVAAGWTIRAIDDGEWPVDHPDSMNVAGVMSEFDNADEINVFFKRDGERAWMCFVRGNDPTEVLCNHSENLLPALAEYEKEVDAANA